MKSDETYRNYLRDLVYLLKEQKAELREENSKDDFNNGIEFGYNSFIELIQSQAEAFQINLEEFGFADFEKHNRRNN